MPTVRDLVGDTTYQRIIDLLKLSFPDAHAIVHEQHADALVLQVWQSNKDSSQNIFGVACPPQPTLDALLAQCPAANPADDFAYYVGHAHHSRNEHPNHAFTGHLPLARVKLPDTTAQAAAIKTAIGDVIPQDHLFASVSQIAFKYSDDLGYEPKRVDLVTPARLGGARFGAIALYLGYCSTDDVAPTFYILEAGLATGESRVAFFSPDMDAIAPTRKWYVPTPFTTDDASYCGKLTMNGDEPATLIVHALSPSSRPEVQVLVEYERTPPRAIWPALLTAQAAARLGSIGVRRGQLTFTDILAPIGDLLDWDKKPE